MQLPAQTAAERARITALRRPGPGFTAGQSWTVVKPASNGLEEEALQRPCPGHVPQPRQRLLLYLAHALARDPEQRADLLQRHRVLAVEPRRKPGDFGRRALAGV